MLELRERHQAGVDNEGVKRGAAVVKHLLSRKAKTVRMNNFPCPHKSTMFTRLPILYLDDLAPLNSAVDVFDALASF